MTSLTKILRKQTQEEKKYFAQPQKYAQEIKALAKQMLTSPRVLLFGSVVKGEETPTSDIDLLLISPSVPKTQEERARIKAKIYKAIGLFSPFEIHLITPSEFSWYKNFIDKKIKI